MLTDLIEYVRLEDVISLGFVTGVFNSTAERTGFSQSRVYPQRVKSLHDPWTGSLTWTINPYDSRADMSHNKKSFVHRYWFLTDIIWRYDSWIKMSGSGLNATSQDKQRSSNAIWWILLKVVSFADVLKVENQSVMTGQGLENVVTFRFISIHLSLAACGDTS